MMVRRIEDMSEFARIWSLASNAVASLPHRWVDPDVEPMASLRYTSFSRLASGAGWSEITEILRNAGHGTVFVGPVVPDPVTYYHVHFNHWNWWSLSASDTDADYWGVLTADPGGSEADAIRFRAELVAWVVSDGAFAIVGDYDHDVAVLCSASSTVLRGLADNWSTVNENLL